MTLEEFIKKHTGKGIDYDGSYGYQCVDLYRQYVDEVLGFPQSPGVMGATDIWESFLVDRFERILNTPEAIPAKGDIVIWNKKVGNGYGHVAVFVSGDVNAFKSFDQNWPAGSLPKLVEHKYTNVIGWLTPKTGDPLTECLKAHSDLMAQLDEKGKKLAEVEKRLADAKSERDTLKDQNESLSELLGKSEADGAKWQNEAETATARIEQLEERVSAVEGERNNYKKWYEAALKKSVENVPAKELFIAWLRKALGGQK